MESADDIARGIEVLDGLVKGVDDLQLFVDPQFRDRVKSCVLREESEPEQFCKGLRGHDLRYMLSKVILTLQMGINRV